MTKKVDNPQAFPVEMPRDPQFSRTDPGMTLRDYFARNAMLHAMSVTAFPVEVGGGYNYPEAAKLAYHIADEMLIARKDTAG